MLMTPPVLKKVEVLSPAWYRAAVEFQGMPERERLAFCSWCCCHGGCNLCADISKYNTKGLKIIALRKIIGAKVKTLCPLKSKGGTVIEKGEICTIVKSYKGYGIRTDDYRTITRVDKCCVEFMKE